MSKFFKLIASTAMVVFFALAMFWLGQGWLANPVSAQGAASSEFTAANSQSLGALKTELEQLIGYLKSLKQQLETALQSGNPLASLELEGMEQDEEALCPCQEKIEALGRTISQLEALLLRFEEVIGNNNATDFSALFANEYPFLNSLPGVLDNMAKELGIGQYATEGILYNSADKIKQAIEQGGLKEFLAILSGVTEYKDVISKALSLFQGINELANGAKVALEQEIERLEYEIYNQDGVKKLRLKQPEGAQGYDESGWWRMQNEQKQYHDTSNTWPQDATEDPSVACNTQCNQRYQACLAGEEGVSVVPGLLDEYGLEVAEEGEGGVDATVAPSAEALPIGEQLTVSLAEPTPAEPTPAEALTAESSTPSAEKPPAPPVEAQPAPPAELLPSPMVTVTSPNGGETWQNGNQYTLTWEASNLLDAQEYITTIFLQEEDEAGSRHTVFTIASDVISRNGQNFLEFTVPESIAEAVNHYLVTVRIETLNNPEDSSDDKFTIQAKPQPPTREELCKRQYMSCQIECGGGAGTALFDESLGEEPASVGGRIMGIIKSPFSALFRPFTSIWGFLAR